MAELSALDVSRSPKGTMAFVVVEKVLMTLSSQLVLIAANPQAKWNSFLREGKPWIRWTVPVTSSAESCLDLVAMLIGTGGGDNRLMHFTAH